MSVCGDLEKRLKDLNFFFMNFIVPNIKNCFTFAKKKQRNDSKLDGDARPNEKLWER